MQAYTLWIHYPTSWFRLQLFNHGSTGEREREKRVYLQLHELDYNHTKCEIQNTG